MILNPMKLLEQYPSNIVKVDGIQVYKYVGSQVHHEVYKWSGGTEINTRIDMAESQFYEHGKKLMNFNIKLSTRILILNSLVRSRLTYGCQTWILSKAQKDRLNSCYTSMLRKMVRGGYRRKTDEWAYKLTNQNLHDLCKTESIASFTERQKCRYLAHLLRLPDTTITKKIVFNADRSVRPGRQTTTLLKSVLEADGSSLSSFARRAVEKKV